MVFGVVVQTKNGYVEGSTAVSASGLPYLSFRGIPYAEPPIGRLRFARPIQVKSWQGMRPAKKYGNDCMQIDMVTRTLTGSEDCLYLNVFSRAKSELSKLPVLVWIHGGAFNYGSGNDLFYGPQRAMDQEIVLVTLNYRLGVLGFLASSDGVFPGNLGLRDQVMALKWIESNIQKFGGNPSNVTLFGESAGAASVHFHTLAAASKGLFHRVILQSGTALSPWAMVEDPDEALKELDKLLELAPGLNNTQRKKQMRELSAEKLLSSAMKITNNFGVPRFLPCVERKVKDGFLTDHPLMLLPRADPKIPMIIGFNADEAAFMVPPLFKVLKKNAKIFNSFFLKSTESQKDAMFKASRIKNRYFGNADLNVHALTGVLTDHEFIYPVFKCLQIYQQSNRNNIFLYRYSHKGSFSLPQLLGYTGPDLGVSHFDEVILQFQNKIFPPPEAESNDEKVSKMLWKAWTIFASGENPKIRELASAWPNVFNTKDFVGVDISTRPMVQSLSKCINFDFWESIKNDDIVKSKL